MRQLFYLLFCTAVLLSCTGKNGKTTGDVPQKSVDSVIQCAVPVSGEFYQITNTCCANIVFTPGPCSINYKGPERLFSSLKINNDNGVLYISMGETSDLSNGKADISLQISCPSLRSLAVCGSGSFSASGCITAQDMNFGNLGTGNIHIDSISCDNMKYELRTAALADIGYIDCRNELSIISLAGGQFSAKGKTTTLLIDAEGDGSVAFSGDYQKKDVFQDKSATVSIN